jgi:hypothetical protein
LSKRSSKKSAKKIGGGFENPVRISLLNASREKESLSGVPEKIAQASVIPPYEMD